MSILPLSHSRVSVIVNALNRFKSCKGLNTGIMLYQWQKVENTFLPVIEQKGHLVSVDVFRVGNFNPSHGFYFKGSILFGVSPLEICFRIDRQFFFYASSELKKTKKACRSRLFSKLFKNSYFNFLYPYTARSPSSSSMRRSWLYLAMRSERLKEPVLIWPLLVATAMSAMVESSVSPERWLVTVV